jgi:hypothetical protein
MDTEPQKIAPASEKAIQAILDEKQLLAQIPISRRTLGNWKTKGFPHIKIGRRCLYSWSNVEAYLLRQQRGGETT